MNKITLDSEQLICWFNAVRNVPENQRTRALDAFWSGQIQSKCWLVNELNKVCVSPSNVYIFGGWIGVLANVLLQRSTYDVLKVRSIDLDPWCEPIADELNQTYKSDGWRFKAVTTDMSNYRYDETIRPHIVINTSTEHVTQEVYEQWYNNIPANTVVVAQGNNYFSCDEHIRCTSSLGQFLQLNQVSEPLFKGELETDMYTRYMAIWIKK